MEKSENLMTKFLGNILDIQQLPILILKKNKNIEDFIIHIKEEDDEIKLTFHPNLAKGESPKLGGKTSLGRTVVYLISKKDKKIIKINYQK
ncbi:hypothetical protein [Janthinobacterium tructae]|uniref:hypothetical protein n=1 Tax=Janthinobacterium tructae TaxID=2590869 RepID=UPI00249A1AE5|nr:hypothetical protein [Janthinobacterium tructae]MDI3292357.1 hypothetical protein [Janthinobacterium tructae]